MNNADANTARGGQPSNAPRFGMTSRPTLHDLQDDALLQAALRRYSAQQPPARSAWTYRLALLGFLLGGAAFVMEAVSLSGKFMPRSGRFISCRPKLTLGVGQPGGRAEV